MRMLLMAAGHDRDDVSTKLQRQAADHDVHDDVRDEAVAGFAADHGGGVF